MDFHALLAKMKEIDRAPVQSAPAVEACGDPMSMPPSAMPVSQPTTTPPPSHPSMSVNLNAQGMDNIEQMMKLFQKVNPDMMPKINPSPTPMVAPMPGMLAAKPEIPPLKMLPDFDADNDNKVGGEMDLDKPDMGEPKIDIDLPPDHDKDHDIVKTLDKDGDGDHDMDDHDMDDTDQEEPKDDIDSDEEPKKEDGGFQNATTKPEEKFSDIDHMVNKFAGGMNSNHGTYPKVADGDNPLQKIKESDEDSFRASIRADLERRLNEAKGLKLCEGFFKLSINYNLTFTE